MALHPALADVGDSTAPPVSRAYAWLVFALIFGLLLSDYMSRQVLNAVFPLLKAEWGLSDTQLGSLSSIVALMVGLLTFPLSLLADLWGRVKSLVIMASLWSLATLGCAVSASYGEMFAARFFVGVGEAACGSVGVAVVISVFPPHLRGTLTGAFTSGGAFGSVLGVALGGIVAVHLGWRWAFGAMALFGLVLVAAFRLIVTEKKVGAQRRAATREPGQAAAGAFGFRKLLIELFGARSVVCVYIGSGLQLFVPAALFTWAPSFLNRYYAMAPDSAGLAAAALGLITGIGMIGGGIVADRVSEHIPTGAWTVAIVYCLASFTLLTIAFQLEAGRLQLVMLGAGMLLAAATTGPAGALVANLTPWPVHATAFATLTLAYNFLGLAPGPFLTGILADRIGLLGALQLVPLASLVATAALVIGKRHDSDDLCRVGAPGSRTGNAGRR